LKDIEAMNEIIHNQSTEIALIKFENDKLMNLYQNKEKLLGEKRDQMADIQANYDELLEEKNYIEQQYLNVNDSKSLTLKSIDTDYHETNEIPLLNTLIKSLQKERNTYKSKMKSIEKDLLNKKIEFYIMEEKEQIWKREREFYIKQHSLIKAE